MVAPFANYSVAGWTWYQGENNVYGDMGNSKDGTGYGCSLPAMINLWRSAWCGNNRTSLFFQSLHSFALISVPSLSGQIIVVIQIEYADSKQINEYIHSFIYI
jgi:hypothetical protein